MQIQLQHFLNTGCLMAKLPDSLFLNLKKDCDLANKHRYSNNELGVQEMISGLTGPGTPKHYFLSNSSQTELNEYVLQLTEIYNTEYKYFDIQLFLTSNLPLISGPAWINIQEKYEFTPNHSHDGILSYVIWVKIPYDTDKEVSQKGGAASLFQFTYLNTYGKISTEKIYVDKNYEGVIAMFPSSQQHCVYPFYTSNENRISISGNILYNSSLVL
jgi:hypothetical protein